MADEQVTPNQGTGPGDHPGGGHGPSTQNGTGPGDHPGITIVKLTGEITTDTTSIEAALDSGRSFLFQYQAGGNLLAVFASVYK